MSIKTLNAYTKTFIFIEDPVVKMTSTGKNSMKVVLRVVFSAMYIVVYIGGKIVQKNKDRL